MAALVRSDVWAFFDRPREEGKERAVCRLCSKTLVHKSSGTTSNLIKHLSAVHPTQWQGQKQANLSAGSEGEDRPKTRNAGQVFFVSQSAVLLAPAN